MWSRARAALRVGVPRHRPKGPLRASADVREETEPIGYFLPSLHRVALENLSVLADAQHIVLPYLRQRGLVELRAVLGLLFDLADARFLALQRRLDRGGQLLDVERGCGL